MISEKQQDNWNAQHYKKHSNGQYSRGINNINTMNFRGDEYVLDVGCGDGRITAEVAKRVPRGLVLGIDISPNMLAEAKKCFGNIKNLEFNCVDAAKFLSDKKFDVVVSNSTFHWIKDQIGALKMIHEHLKPGGKLVMKMSAVYLGPVTAVNHDPKWLPLLSSKEKTHFPGTVESISSMLKTCGFNSIDVKPEVASQCFQTKEDLFNWAFAWVPHSTGLPDAQAREFTQDIVDSVCNAQQDKRLIVESVLLNIHAIK